MNVEKYLCKIFFIQTDKGVRFSTIRKRFVCRTKLNRYPNINAYLENKYSDWTDYHPYTDKETLFRIKNNIGENEMPKCPVCGKIALFHDYEYRKYCSTACTHSDKDQYKRMVETQKKNLKEKYGEGITNYAQLESTKKKIAETTLKHYGNTCFLGSKKARELYKEKTGYDNPLQNPETKEKVKQTCIDKYGNKSFLGSDEYMSNVDKIQDKITKTCIDKYGTKRYSQTQEYKDQTRHTWEEKPLDEINDFLKKQFEAKKENGTLMTSAPEDETFELLKMKFHDVVRQYRSDKYPFACDFFIPSLQLYIECHYTWTHGKHPYNEDIDKEELVLWESKAETSDYYKNAIYTWTDLDVRKKKCFIDNKLNYKIFYTIEDFKNWYEISIPYDIQELKDELEYYRDAMAKLSAFPTKNNIVKYYQQETFYKREKELWNDDKIKEKLINNRIQYLNKTDFVATELLLGFKISGIYYGYSHFHPMIVKYVCEKYNTKICYDPCGGWGHHILGALNIDKYIYNDLSTHTYNNVLTMCNDLNINNVVCYNNDCSTFVPEDNFDTMISCPPYYNVEEYECGIFANIAEYNKFIDNLFTVFNNKTSCNVFALIIREDLIDVKKHVPTEIYELHQPSSHLIKEKKNKEKLYIFKKLCLQN